MHLGNVNMLLLLWLLPAVAALYFYAAWRRGKAMRVFIDEGLLDRISMSVNQVGRRVKAALVIVALAFLIVALARPAWNPKPRTVQRKGRDIVFVLDVSRSMIAEDLVPSRLGKAKYSIMDMIDSLEGDRVALVVYAGSAVLKCPLTLDYGFFKLMLEDVDTYSVTRGGTMIGDAIRKALDEAFDDQEKKYKDMILITDGEDHDSYPEEAAQAAVEAGIRIMSIGFGSETGSEITLVDPRTGARSILTDKNGQVVRSRLDGELLRDLALATEGVYVPAGTSALDLDSIVEAHVEPLITDSAAGRTRTVIVEYYRWFVLGSLVALFATVWVGSTSGKRRNGA